MLLEGISLFYFHEIMNHSNLGFGTAAIGRPMYINIRSQVSEPFDFDKFKADGIQMLENAYKSGIRYFDTAPGYGMSEELLIEWLKSKNNPSIEIATKWGYEYTANFDPTATSHEVKEHSLKMLQKQWQQSEKLFPHLSTYQIHSATFDTGVLENEEVLNELNRLKAEYGLKIGLTTSGDNQTEVLAKALKNDLFEVYQVTYNVFDQSLRHFVETNDLSGKRIIIKEGLANGRAFRNSSFSHYNNAYTLLDNLATKYDVGVDAIALQFCAQTIDTYSVLSGASLKEQLDQNSKAIGLELTESEVDQLKQLAVEPKAYWKERKQMEWN